MRAEKKTLILTLVLILLPILVGVILWDRLPERLPTHFSFDGTPDDYSPKAFAVFGMPIFLAFMQLILFFVTMADPKNQRVSSRINRLVLWIVPVVGLVVQLVV